MNLDEQAINFVKDYFDAIAHNAVTEVYEKMDSDTPFAEFMEALFHQMGRLASEQVAAEVLQVSLKTIETYHGGGGMDVDDVQELIDNYDDEIDPDDIE